MNKNTVKAMIYNMSGDILLGKAKEEKVKKIIALAKEYNLLPLVKQEFGELTKTLTPQH